MATTIEQVEKEYGEVKTTLAKVSDDIKRYAEDTEKQIKNFGTISQETKADVDKLLVSQGELQARLHAAEQLVVKLETQGLGESARPLSLGAQVITSDRFKAWDGQGKLRVPVKATITSDTGSSGDLIVPQRLGFIAQPQMRLTIRDLLTWGRTASNSIEYVREVGYTSSEGGGFSNRAAVVSENPSAVKPKSSITFEMDSAPIVTIAHHIKASKQVIADAPMLQSYIDGRLRYGLKLVEESQLLKGSGVGLNIEGLVTAATAYANPGVTVANETLIDRLRIAMLQVALAEYDADGIVISPIDWATIELTKTSDNAYLFATPRGLAAPGLWGRPVVATQSMDAGDFLVGNFTQAASGWDREDMNVTVATENEDDFLKNLVTILCEERVGLTIYRPEALIVGDFDGLEVSSAA